MNSSVSGIFKWVIYVFLGFYSIDVNAGHILGTDITYANVAPNTYLIRVRWYRDCQGLPASQQISICYRSMSFGISNSLILNAVPSGQYYLPNFPYWPPMSTSCVGGPATGIEKNTYEGVLTLPSVAADWIVSYSTFPQNIGINQNFMYVSTKIDNLNYPQNSSSSFVNDPTFLYCVSQPAWDNFVCTDADGDSLSYHLIPILDNTTVCPSAPFQNPLPAFSPLQSSTPIAMDSTNGTFTFTPNLVGTAMVSARVDEFRNGILINSSTIEHVFYIVPGCVVTEIDEPSTVNVQLHPNPVIDVLFIEIKNSEPLIIEAIDITGKTSKVDFTPISEGNFELQINALSKGIYSLKVITEKSTTVQKFLKL